MAMNYNDGKWHGWNGEENPPSSVHEKSIIEYVWHYECNGSCGVAKMAAYEWDEEGQRPAWERILKFRVIKEHKEPREWWALWSPSGYLVGIFPKYIADIMNDERHNGTGEVVHIREVLDNES